MACHNNIHCERCGDCLECYWEDQCYDGDAHTYPPNYKELEAQNEAADKAKAELAISPEVKQ